jgi:hypothetical protein
MTGGSLLIDPSMKKTSFLIALLPAVLFFAGCGTGEYEKRIASSLQGANSGPKVLAETPTTIPGAPFSVRIPTVMQSVETSDAVRGKCPLFDIPGLKATYEGCVEEESKNKQCFYLYIGVIPLPENNYLPTQAWLSELQNFKEVSDSSTGVNKSYTVSSPEGSSVQYDEIHFKCKQKFHYPKPDNPNNSQDMLGNVVCLSHVENGQVVLLVFRYPDTLKDIHGSTFDSEWLKMIAGTLKAGG